MIEEYNVDSKASVIRLIYLAHQLVMFIIPAGGRCKIAPIFMN